MRRCGVIVAGRQVNVARPRLLHLRSAFCRTQNTRTTQKRTRTLVRRHPDEYKRSVYGNSVVSLNTVDNNKSTCG